MKIALVHDWLTGMRGGEKVIEVFCKLFPHADLYTLVYDRDALSPAIQRMNIRSSWIDRLPGSRNYFRYLLPLFPKTIENFELEGYDLVLSSSHCVAKGIFPRRALHVSYVHAPMRYVWDLGEAYFAGGASVAVRAGLSLWGGYLRRWDRRSTQRVDHFIASSKNVAAKIRRIYGRDAQVIYPPVDIDKFYLSKEIQPYYLIVSALVPYKRIDLAVEVFNKVQLPLKIVGDGPLRSFLQKGAGSNIEFEGWVDETRLAELYARCQALVFPGEEDFGIVAVEAQASGRPVIAFNRGGLCETVIGLDDPASPHPPTGIFFSEQSATNLIAAIELYQKRRGDFWPDTIRQQAVKFSRQRFRREMTDFLAGSMAHSRTGR